MIFLHLTEHLHKFLGFVSKKEIADFMNATWIHSLMRRAVASVPRKLSVYVPNEISYVKKITEMLRIVVILRNRRRKEQIMMECYEQQRYIMIKMIVMIVVMFMLLLPLL